MIKNVQDFNLKDSILEFLSAKLPLDYVNYSLVVHRMTDVLSRTILYPSETMNTLNKCEDS